MKPVHQTRFGYPDGNCLAAALASVLEIDIDVIPEFGIDDKWYERFSRYMVSHHALQPIDIDAPTIPDWMIPRGYYLINGRSPRGDFHHTIVGFNGNAIHDPLPDGACKLESVTSYTVFIVLDPKTMAWENQETTYCVKEES